MADNLDSVKPRDILVDYFGPGEVPCAEHFEAIINSFVHHTEDGVTICKDGARVFDFKIRAASGTGEFTGLHLDGDAEIATWAAGQVPDIDPAIAYNNNLHGTCITLDNTGTGQIDLKAGVVTVNNRMEINGDLLVTGTMVVHNEEQMNSVILGDSKQDEIKVIGVMKSGEEKQPICIDSPLLVSGGTESLKRGEIILKDEGSGAYKYQSINEHELFLGKAEREPGGEFTLTPQWRLDRNGNVTISNRLDPFGGGLPTSNTRLFVDGNQLIKGDIDLRDSENTLQGTLYGVNHGPLKFAGRGTWVPDSDTVCEYVDAGLVLKAEKEGDCTVPFNASTLTLCDGLITVPKRLVLDSEDTYTRFQMGYGPSNDRNFKCFEARDGYLFIGNLSQDEAEDGKTVKNFSIDEDGTVGISVTDHSIIPNDLALYVEGDTNIVGKLKVDEICLGVVLSPPGVENNMLYVGGDARVTGKLQVGDLFVDNRITADELVLLPAEVGNIGNLLYVGGNAEVDGKLTVQGLCIGDTDIMDLIDAGASGGGGKTLLPVQFVQRKAFDNSWVSVSEYENITIKALQNIRVAFTTGIQEELSIDFAFIELEMKWQESATFSTVGDGLPIPSGVGEYIGDSRVRLLATLSRVAVNEVVISLPDSTIEALEGILFDVVVAHVQLRGSRFVAAPGERYDDYDLSLLVTPRMIRANTIGSRGTSLEKMQVPYGLDAMENGNAVVADRGLKKVVEYDSDGNFVQRYGKFPGNNITTDIEGTDLRAISNQDSNGYYYFTDAGNGMVWKTDVRGNYIDVLGGKGSAKGQFDSPANLVVGEGDRILIYDTNLGRFTLYDKQGDYVKVFAPKSALLDSYNMSLMRFDKDYAVYCPNNAKLEYYDANGDFIATQNIGQINQKMTYDARNIYYIDGERIMMIEKINRAPQVVFDNMHSGETPRFLLSNMAGFATNENGREFLFWDHTAQTYSIDITGEKASIEEYVLDPDVDQQPKMIQYLTYGNNGAVNILGSLTGAYTSDFLKYFKGTRIQEALENPMLSPELLMEPIDVAIAPNSKNVYVLDVLSRAVKWFDASGTPLGYFGGEGIAEHQFDYPVAIEIDNKDRIYVADIRNRAVKRFLPDGTFDMIYEGMHSSTPFDNVSAMTFDSDSQRMYMLDAGLGKVIELDTQSQTPVYREVFSLEVTPTRDAKLDIEFRNGMFYIITQQGGIKLYDEAGLSRGMIGGKSFGKTEYEYLFGLTVKDSLAYVSNGAEGVVNAIHIEGLNPRSAKEEYNTPYYYGALTAGGDILVTVGQPLNTVDPTTTGF
jgi:DNA-binding beta-propeller fold protein YncE